MRDGGILKRIMANKKQSTRGKRYSSSERMKILSFVEKYNATNGRGGAAEASRKYGISQLTIGNWLKAAGAPSPKRKKSNVDISKTLSRIGEVYKEMDKVEKELNELRREYAELRASL